MKWFHPPKSWQKLAPDTIEAWLVSDDPREQSFADYALTHLGSEGARAYLHRLVTIESCEKDKTQRYTHWSFWVVWVISGALGITTGNDFWLAPLAAVLPASICVDWIRRTQTSRLQRCLTERLTEERDIHYLPTIIHTLKTTMDTRVANLAQEALIRLLPQINPANKAVVPADYWQRLTDALDDLSKRKAIKLIPSELAFAVAHIEALGNVRHEPALPALRTLATRDATTPQASELKGLAARYVAEWDAQPARTMAARTETPPAPLRLNACKPGSLICLIVLPYLPAPFPVS